MGQPGPGSHVISPPLIIESTWKRPTWVRRLEWILSALMWLLYFYLIRDALIDAYLLIHESFEWAFAGDERPHLPTIASFLRTLRDYSVVAATNGGILIAWALYNQIRFRGRDRHTAKPAVTVADLALFYGLAADDIARWQNSRILVMQHDPDGNLVSVVAKASA